MTTETLHGMLERLEHEWTQHEGRDATHDEDCFACRLQPLADQLQAVVERIPHTTLYPLHNWDWNLGKWGDPLFDKRCDKCQLQRILGTPGK